jgi:hypothetical protein
MKGETMLEMLNKKRKLRYHIVFKNKGYIGSVAGLEDSYACARALEKSKSYNPKNRATIWIYDSKSDVFTLLAETHSIGNMWEQGYPPIES